MPAPQRMCACSSCVHVVQCISYLIVSVHVHVLVCIFQPITYAKLLVVKVIHMKSKWNKKGSCIKEYAAYMYIPYGEFISATVCRSIALLTTVANDISLLILCLLITVT